LAAAAPAAPSASQAARPEAVASLIPPRVNHAAHARATPQGSGSSRQQHARLWSVGPLAQWQGRRSSCDNRPHRARSLARRVAAAAASGWGEHQHAAAKLSGGAAADSKPVVGGRALHHARAAKLWPNKATVAAAAARLLGFAAGGHQQQPGGGAQQATLCHAPTRSVRCAVDRSRCA
jgi:hypothetical protein